MEPFDSDWMKEHQRLILKSRTVVETKYIFFDKYNNYQIIKNECLQ